MSTCQLPLICIAPKTPSNGEFHYTMLILFPIHLYSKSKRHLPSAEVWRKLKIAPYFAHSYGQTWHWTLTITLHTALCVIMVVVGVESLICGTNLECLPKMLTSYFRSMASTIHVWWGWTQSQKWQKWILGMLPEIPTLTTLTEEHQGSITDETVKDINSLVSLHSEERLLCCESSVLMHSVAIRGTILETALSVRWLLGF